VHTVSAGGGSIAEADAGGALKVGPRSAGADPGPAAYGLGGEEPTVTDANLFLGYLGDGAELGGELTLDADAAETALTRVGARLGLDALATARGVLAVADAEMIRALRVISVQRGLDPRNFALVAFGGAGGMHACALAEELDMATVLVPRASGVLSALGLAVSDLRRDYVSPLISALDEIDPDRFEEVFGDLEARAAEDLPDPALVRRADLRYRGQSFELTVEAAEPGALAERFAEAHEQRYGFRTHDPVDVVSVRVVATSPVEKPELAEDPPPSREAGAGEPARRRAYFDDGWREVPVVERAVLGRGSEVTGPALVEFAEATCVVRPGWAGTVDGAGTLVLERSPGAGV